MRKPIKINLNWLFPIFVALALVDLFTPHAEHVYRNDPATILISLAVSAIATGAQYGAQALLTKKVKPTPVDRGKVDDIRISSPGYGVLIPWGRGTFRVAPIWFWHTPIVHTTRTTPGQSGGKGTPTPPTPDTVDHIYTTNLAGAVHDGLIYKGFSRIWFNADLVYNANLATNLADTAATRYEAEFGVLAGGASVVVQAECSEGNKVTGLGSGGSVTIHTDVAASGSYEVAVFYTSTAQRTFKVSVNGGATVDLVCPPSGGANMVRVEMITLTLTSGANTIAFSNSGAACPDLDCIDVTPALVFDPGTNNDPRSFTGLITPGKIAPTNQDQQWATANELPTFSDTAGGVTNGGFYTATLSKWGSPQIRMYPGSETQMPDPVIIADQGAGNAPAYRGTAYLVIEGLQCPNGQLPNVTVEVNQGIREAATILQDVYELVNIARSDVDVTQLAGAIIGDTTGFNPGTYTPITWTGLSNATQTTGGAITKTSGADHAWNSYATNGVTLAAGTDYSIRFTAQAGTFMIGFSKITTPGGSLPHPYDQALFGVLLNLNSNPSQENKNAIQVSLGGFNNSSDVGVWAVGDQFQVEIRNGRFAVYQNGLLLTGFSPPVPSFPLFPVFAGYAVGGGVSAASFASGANIGSEPVIANAGALLLDSQKQASELVIDLQTRFQFDLPEVDGKVKVVLRAGTPELTITESELRARRNGEQIPQYAAKITDGNPLELPFKVEVNYLDPQLDYHNNQQSDRRLIDGPGANVTPISLAMIETAANMQNLAVLLRQRAICENRKFTFTTGPKYMKLHQGAVLSLVLLNATHTIRITDMRFDLPAGLCEFNAVRHAASLYTPNAAGHPGGGTERPIVPIPGATKGVFIDAPLIEPESAGDEPKALLYVAMTGRGSGVWPGGFLNREFPAGSGIYDLVTSADKPATIGKTTAPLASVADPTVLDTTSVLTVDFYSDGSTIESVTLTELQNNPKLNLLWIARTTDGEGEYVQFETATPLSTSAPFVSRYQFTNLLRGRFNTAGNVGIHLSGDDVVLMNSAIKVVPMESTRLGLAINYKFVTVGQDPDDAAIVANTWRGYSLKAETPASIAGNYDQANGSLLLDWIDETVLSPTSDDAFELEIRNGPGSGATTIRGPIPIKPIDLARVSGTPPLKAKNPGGSYLSLGAYSYVDPGGFDVAYSSSDWDTFGLHALVESDSPVTVRGGMMLETQVAEDPLTGNLFPSVIGLTPVGGFPGAIVAGWIKHSSINPDVIFPLGAPIGKVYHMVKGDRFTLIIQPDGTVAYYINYHGAISDPWYVSATTIDFSQQYKVQFWNEPYPTGGSSHTLRVRNTRWLRNMPEYIYTGDQQKADNSGSLPSTVYVRVRKRSVHPLGPASDWLYQSFVR